MTTSSVELPGDDGDAFARLRSGAAHALRWWRLAGTIIPFVILFTVLSIASQPL